MLPGLDELRETVEHMEQSLAASPDAGELMAAYEEVRTRFAADLDDERDELLSRGGALMLIQGAVGRAHAAHRAWEAWTEALGSVSSGRARRAAVPR
jgi:hypothetical protein